MPLLALQFVVLLALAALVDAKWQWKETKEKVKAWVSHKRNISSRGYSDANYVIVLDAGSTGTRIYIYRYNDSSPFESLQAVTQKRVSPGTLRCLSLIFLLDACSASLEILTNPLYLLNTALSSFYNNTEGLSTQVSTLLDFAMASIPRQDYERTPISLKATAGLRKLPEKEQDWLISIVRLKLDESSFVHKSSSHYFSQSSSQASTSTSTINEEMKGEEKGKEEEREKEDKEDEEEEEMEGFVRGTHVISGEVEATFDMLAVSAAFPSGKQMYIFTCLHICVFAVCGFAFLY